MKKYSNFKAAASMALLICLTVVPMVHAQTPASTSEASGPTGKITCFSRKITPSLNSGELISFTIGTDGYFTNANHVSAYSYSSDNTIPKSPRVWYSSGNKTNRIVLSTNGYHVDFATIPLTILYADGLTTVDKDMGGLMTFGQSVAISSNLPACTGPILRLPEPPAPPPSSSGGGGENCPDPNFVEKNTCTDGIKNGDETAVDEGGRCDMTAKINDNGPGTNAALFGHWPGSTKPREISYINNLSPMYSKWLPKAIASWNLAGEGAIHLQEGGNAPIQITVTSGNFGATGWVGVVTTTNSEIMTFAPMKVNDYYLRCMSYLNTDSQRLFVVIHELGHTFGMEHNNENFSDANKCDPMDYTGDTDGSISGQCSNLYPNKDSSEKIKAKYANTD